MLWDGLEPDSSPGPGPRPITRKKEISLPPLAFSTAIGYNVRMSTTYHSPIDIVLSPSRVIDNLRSAERNLTIGDCTIANRSNYTRVVFKFHRGAAFLAPVGPYSVRAHALPHHGALMVVRGLDGEAVRMALSPSELRSMAYMMLAAANWIDSRDDQFDQNRRKPGANPKD